MTVGFVDSLRGWRRLLPGALGAAALVVLAGCGGGDRTTTFAPQRMLVFGDESSVLVGPSTTTAAGVAVTAPTGSKYMINALKDDPASADPAVKLLDCPNNALWIQSLSSYYNFTFAECSATPVASPTGIVYAKPGAKVADVATQVAAHTATSSFSNTDLVTVFAGQNDLLEAYAQIATIGEAGVIARAEAAGLALAAQVNGIGNAGGRVLIVTLPNLGATPFARAEEAANPGRASTLRQASERFNGRLRFGLINDGRIIGLLQLDELVTAILNNASFYGLANVSDAACLSTAPLPSCTTDTLVTGATSGTHLWADGTHIGPNAHGRLGNLAVSRAVNNPF